MLGRRCRFCGQPIGIMHDECTGCWAQRMAGWSGIGEVAPEPPETQTPPQQPQNATRGGTGMLEADGGVEITVAVLWGCCGLCGRVARIDLRLADGRSYCAVCAHRLLRVAGKLARRQYTDFPDAQVRHETLMACGEYFLPGDAFVEFNATVLTRCAWYGISFW